MIAALYALYEATRGLVTGARPVAVAHAHDIAALERSLHAFFEPDVQRAVRGIPGLLTVFGFLYLTCHLGVTGGVLIWLHRSRRDRYALYRTTLVLATALSIVGFVVYPTAPPRLSGLGLADTISGHANIDLNKGLLHQLYNPFAAVPSMHAGYALIIGAALVLCGRHVATRLVGMAYPAVVVLVIIATGNHFWFDAVTGFAVAVLAAVISLRIVSGRSRSSNDSRLTLEADRPVDSPLPGR